MALSTPWSLSTIITKVRRELLDSNSKWWTDAEITSYASDWQSELQQRFEFVWGTSSVVGTAGTYTLSTLTPEPLRLDAVYWNDDTHKQKRLVGMSPQDLDDLNRDWRDADEGYPEIVTQTNNTTFQLVPTPLSTGTMLLEYPITLTLATGTDTVSIPAWTQYSAIPYCCYRAYKRLGPNQDINKALRYKARFVMAARKLKTIYTSYLPLQAPALRPASTYERNILHPSLGSVR